MPRARGKAARRQARGGDGLPGKPVKADPAAADTPFVERTGGYELAELRRLIELVQETGIGELEVTTGGKTIRIAAQAAASPMVAAPPAASPTPPALASAPPAPAGASASGTQVAINSPMVGTFYRAPAPDADPYVEVGDMVTVGQTVCIVEAMKLMNEIESEVKGRVAAILVENAQPVEYGQALFLVEPS